MIKVTKTSAVVLAGAAFSMTAPTLAAEPEQDADYTASQQMKPAKSQLAKSWSSAKKVMHAAMRTATGR